MEKVRQINLILWIMLFSICLVPQAEATTYYVSLSGNNNWPGTSPDSAWRTIAHAGSLLIAGDSVFIDAGTYTDEHVEIINSGDSLNPIVFEGYNGKPVLDGIDRTGTAINVESKNYILLKDLKIVRYQRGVNLHFAKHGLVENLTVDGMGEDDGFGIALRGARFCEVRNCTLTDGTHMNFYLWSAKNCLIEDCILNSIDTAYGAVDYHIYMEESDSNTIRNCIARNFHPQIDIHPGHAIALKLDCDHNLIIGCEAYSVGEFFVAAHYSHHNEFRDCIGYDEGGYHSLHWNFGLVARDGAYDNKFINCEMYGATNGFLIVNTVESTDTTKQRRNIFENCIVCCYEYGHPYAWNEAYMFQIKNALDNVIKNCVIGGFDYLYIINSGVEQGNIIKNSIIVDFPNYYYGQAPNLTYAYCDFWNIGFSPPPGTGNIYMDPLFADHDTLAPGDYHLKSEAGRWNGHEWVYDDTTSPCIDAGDPADDYSNEPEPNGDRINMGAYGNTSEASKTPEPGTKEKISSLPKSYSLMQNYPNPFISATEIRYVLQKETLVELVIYNTLGEKIRTLVKDKQKAGYHKISWDGTDDSGKAVAGGIYFCQFKVDDFISTKKVIWLK